MISIAASSKPKAGSVFCVTITGNVGDVDVIADIDGVPVAVTITDTGHGIIVCVKIPDSAGHKVITISASDKKGNEATFARGIGK